MPSQSQISPQLYGGVYEVPDVPTKTVKTVDYYVQAWRELDEVAARSHMSYAAQLVTIALDAKYNLDKDQFKAFQEAVHLKDSMWYKAIKVAEEQKTEDGKLYELKLAGMLPSGFTVQYQLLFLPKDVLSDAVQNGFFSIDDKQINPVDLDIKQVKRLRQLIAGTQPTAIGTAARAGAGKKPTHAETEPANLEPVKAGYSKKPANSRLQGAVYGNGRHAHQRPAELEKKVARTAMAAANDADHMDAAEYLAKTPEPADSSTLIARTPESATTQNLDWMRKPPGLAVVTEPDSADGPTNEEPVGTQDLDDEGDLDNDVRIMSALRIKYDALCLDIVERKIYKALRESGMHDVKVTLTLYN